MTRLAETENRWSSRLQSADRRAITAADRTVAEMVRMLHDLDLQDRAITTPAAELAHTG